MNNPNRLRFLTSILFLGFIQQSHERLQSWERTCVVGECVKVESPFLSCSEQSMDVRLGHPSQKGVRSEPVFRNRPFTLAVEPCPGRSKVGGRRSRRNNFYGGGGSSGEYMPICCPDKKKEALLIAGIGAGSNEFPHQVRLLIKSPSGVREKCGGTIYSKDYILTSASCLVYNGHSVGPADVEVITGQNLEHTKNSNNIHSVRNIKIHEGYKGAVKNYGRDHDIAILKLQRSLDLSSRGSPRLKALRIPEKGFRSEGKRAIILGWGRTAGEEKPIGALLKMNAYINTKEECSQKSAEALKNGNDLRKIKIENESPHDSDGIPDTFEISKGVGSGGRGKSTKTAGDRGGHRSIFDDDFFHWGKGASRLSSLSEWDKNHAFVNLNALQLGILWVAGVEYNNKERTSTLQPMSQFPSSLLCVGGGKNTLGYNRGDSGGPAICDGKDGTPILCGVSSFGRNEFRGEWPASYVNVAQYADWIKSNTVRQNEDSLIKDIIDGEPISSFEEASFFVRIHNKKTNTTCGGALINSKTVISSVSCVPADVRVDDLIVTSGQLSEDEKGTNHEVEGASTRETYKSYQSRSQNRREEVSESTGDSSEIPGGRLGGDFPQLNLATLKIYPAAKIAKPIDLIKPEMDRMVVYEYGWRNDGRDRAVNKWSYREVPLPECKAKYGAIGIEVDEHHLCATETYSGGERCNNDLGNPLICVDRQGRTYLCGVTSIRDCTFSFPTVFTNVVENLDWIQL